MTAPAPLGLNVNNNHIAKRAPSRHDNASNSTRIISTLDLHYRIRDIRRKPHLLGFTPDCLKMSFTPRCIGLRHPDETLNNGRQWDIREIG